MLWWCSTQVTAAWLDVAGLWGVTSYILVGECERFRWKCSSPHCCSEWPLSCTRWLYYSMCLTMSCCPLCLCVTVMKTCTACKMEHRHILRGLTAALLVGGLGVVDQHYGVVSVQRGSVPIKCKNGRWLGTTNSRHCSYYLSWLLKQTRCVCVCHVAEVWQMLGDVCSNLR